MGKLVITDCEIGSVKGNIVIGEINMDPKFGEVITLRVGKNEKYKTINQAIASIPRNMVNNYQIIDMDIQNETRSR
jgi:hypothetical protein